MAKKKERFKVEIMTREKANELALKQLVCDHYDLNGKCVYCGMRSETDQQLQA